MSRPSRFTIRAASALTGINQNTLRAWERRHRLVRPERTPKGYRLYSDDDIERLRLIQRALQEGIAIGRVRACLETPGTVERLMASAALPLVASTRSTRVAGISPAGAGREGATTTRIPGDDRPRSTGLPPASFAEQIEQAALRLDRAGLKRAFGRAVGLSSLRQAFHHALAPALARIGQRHREGLADEPPERFLTAFAREELLGALAGLRPLHQQPRALFACVPGERHEIGLMLLSLEVGLEGVSALYLGADTPVEAFHRAAGAAGTRAVALSASHAVPQETVLGLRDRLAALPRGPRLLIGGPAAWEKRKWLDANGIEVLSPEPQEARAQVLHAIGSAQVGTARRPRGRGLAFLGPGRRSPARHRVVPCPPLPSDARKSRSASSTSAGSTSEGRTQRNS